MDDQNMSLDLSEDEITHIKHLSRRMGEFIALFEVAEEKMSAWEKQTQETLQTNNKLVKSQLQDIQNATAELKEIMTETGAARWRLAAEKALAQGEDHVKTLSGVTEEFTHQAKESLERLDRASSYVIKNICEATASFDFDDFKDLVEHSCEKIDSTSHTAIKRLNKLVRWLYWKSICVSIAVALLVTLGFCFYLNDQWPWEMHHQAKTEREAGHALIKIWPYLTEAEKTKIHRFYTN